MTASTIPCFDPNNVRFSALGTHVLIRYMSLSKWAARSDGFTTWRVFFEQRTAAGWQNWKDVLVTNDDGGTWRIRHQDGEFFALEIQVQADRSPETVYEIDSFIRASGAGALADARKAYQAAKELEAAVEAIRIDRG